MPRSIINLALENDPENQCKSEVNQLTDNQSDEIINGNECNSSNTNSLSVFNESQLRDITEVLEIQSRNLILTPNDGDDDEIDGEDGDDHDDDDDEKDENKKVTLNSDGNNNNDDQSAIKSKEVNQCESRSASGLGESCSNSCYSTSSSSLPSNDAGSDQIIETNQVISSSSSPSSPITSATVTVSTCPSCGSENVDPCSKLSLTSTSSSSTSSPAHHHHRYSNELSSSSSAKWKSYSRPEIINSKSSYRSSPYKVKSHCTNSSLRQSSRHHHGHHSHSHSHHHHHHGHHHRLNSRSKKHSLSSELDMIRSKSKSKRDRYSCSKLSPLNENARCHVCKQDEHDESRLHSFNQRSSSSSTIKPGDCPYSLTTSSYDDDHLMSHLCDIDSWHRRRKRETLKKKERAIIAILSIIAILIFIAMSYFGTILFLRITTMPIS